MKKKPTANIKHIVAKWELTDFFRNFIAVVLGIVITFVGSDIITKHHTQNEIKEAMRLVRSELLMNKLEVEKAGKQIALDQNGARYLLEYKGRVSEMPKDSLNIYGSLPFQWHNFHFTSDALEMLKVSALIQNMENKELALNIIKTYGAIQNVDNLFKIYSKYKEQAQNAVSAHPKAKAYLYNHDANDLVSWWNLLFTLPEGLALIMSIQKIQNPQYYFDCSKQIDETIIAIDKESN